MSITIRMETEKDYLETENLTREAFWDVYKPGCDEHLVLHQLRQSEAFVPELDLVACDGALIVGNIVYSRAVVRGDGGDHAVLCMGPLCVHPARQKEGIGDMLMRTSMQKAKELGHAAVIIFGSPDYYHRFGFRNAGDYGIQTADGGNFDAFMALDLQGNGLPGIHGRFFEDGAFAVDPGELEKFERNFPPREKHKREGQLFG